MYLLRCHVMEVESFEDEEIAKLLNDWFVSIKVSMSSLYAVCDYIFFSIAIFLSRNIKF